VHGNFGGYKSLMTPMGTILIVIASSSVVIGVNLGAILWIAGAYPEGLFGGEGEVWGWDAPPTGERSGKGARPSPLKMNFSLDMTFWW